MDFPLALGVTLGIVIGGTYALLQLSALQKNEKRQREGSAPRMAGMLPGSMLRIALLLGALIVVQMVVPTEYKTTRFKLAMTISLALAYSVPFFWRLKDMMRDK